MRLAGQPLIGHLAQFRRDPLGLLERCAATPDPVVELQIRTPAYVLKTAEDVRHVVVSNAGAYEKTARIVGSRGERVGGGGVFFRAGGAGHRRGRDLLRDPMGRKSVPRLAPEIVESADRTIGAWPDGGTIDLGREMRALTFRAMFRSVFGASPEEAPDLAAGIAVRRRYLERTVGSLLPRPGFVPVALRPSRRRALARFDEVLHAMLAQARSSEDPPESVLADLAREPGPGADAESRDGEIRDQLLALAIAGYRSVSLALTWMLHELARNPASAARLEAEVDAALGGRAPDAADAGRLSYMAMVISETLRLYPPTWLFWRTVASADRLPSGASLPAGAKVMLSPYLVQRSPLYYEQPRRFDPDRMSPANLAERPRFAFFPFGGGTRVCVGRSFALLELTLVAAMLVQRVRFQPVSGEAALNPQIDLRPGEPIEMRVRRR